MKENLCIPLLKEGKTNLEIIDKGNKKTPVVFLHGGPGGAIGSFSSLFDLFEESDRTAIFYDQTGGKGLSTTTLTLEELNMKLWIKELSSLLDYLQKRYGFQRFNLLGHSFGGMLMTDYLLETEDPRISSIIYSSSLVSSRLWEKEAINLVRYLKKEYQEAVFKAIKEGKYDSPSFIEATCVFYNLFVGETDIDSLKNPPSPVYERLWGPSEFVVTGLLKDYDRSKDLKKIKNRALVISGTNDESTPLINKQIYDNLKGEKKWILLEGARHRSYCDNKNEYFSAITTFMDKGETL